MDDQPSTSTTHAKPRRPWYQFSLRTLIFTFAASALILHFWIIPSERQRRSTKDLEKNGGMYVLGNEVSKGNYMFVPNSDSRRWYHHYFKNVKQIYCYDRSQIDWEAFPNLEEIIFGDNGRVSFPEDSETLLTNLAKHNRQLKELDFPTAIIRDESMRHFSSLHKLHRLDLRYVDLSYCSLDVLLSLNDLRELNLIGTKVSDRQIEKLKNHSSLKKIHVEMNPKSMERLRILCDFMSLEEVGILDESVPLNFYTIIPITNLRKILEECNKKSTPEHPYEIKWDLEARKLGH